MNLLKIKLPLYQTADAELRSLTLNYVYFPIKNPQKCHRSLFRDLLYSLWLSGVISYHHENKLYFIFQIPSKNLLNEFNRQLNDFIKNNMDCFPEDFAGNSWQEGEDVDFTDSITITNLYPVGSQKDFNITRSIIYGYFRKIYGFRRNVRSKGTVIYIYRFPENENTYMYDDKFIRQGIEILFEITPKGRGRIWFDIVTHAFKIDELGNTKRLSHPEMKQESMKFYRKYLSLAQMRPRLRYNKLLEMLKTLGIQDKIEFKFYIWSPSKQFKEYSIVFTSHSLVNLHNIS